MTVRDETQPGRKWEFDSAVAEAFDDMLERSIPAYNIMRELTTRLALHFIQSPLASGTVVDLGCSRGGGLRPIVDQVKDPDARFIGVDVSEPMLAAARSSFRNDPRVLITSYDLRKGYPLDDADPTETADVTLAVLTLQFTPIEYRQRILSSIADRTRTGGALLLVEKVLGQTARLHEVFDDEYLRMKSRNGYSDEAIARKRASLEGVLVSVDANTNERWLREAGFRQVDCYYRWLNFAGWVAVR